MFYQEESEMFCLVLKLFGWNGIQLLLNFFPNLNLSTTKVAYYLVSNDNKVGYQY